MAFRSILNMWNKWNIRGFVILSLLLQVSLILFAPLRKKTAKPYIYGPLWLAYLMADWVAAFAIGLISHNQGNSSTHAAEVDRALQAFWASFLLLHLGGPDTITAFSLEDSSLWRRHLLSLIFQASAAIYVFGQIFPTNKLLVIPTMLVFLAALVKNVERTRALHLSSLTKLRESMLSKHNWVQEVNGAAEMKLLKELNVLEASHEEGRLAESIVVKHAYYFFHVFKVFIGDLMFTYREREISHAYFHKVSAVDALRVISVELNFIYEVLHTKALAIRSKLSYICRILAFAKVATALVLFNQLKKHGLPDLDVEITYFLLFGGIALDVISLFMLVFSDWTVAGIKWFTKGTSVLDTVLHISVSAMDNLRKPRFTPCKAKPNAMDDYIFLDTRLIFRRWSESICACNLLSESLKKSPRMMHKHNRRWCITACYFLLHRTKKIISFFHEVVETIIGACGPRNTREEIPMSEKIISFFHRVGKTIGGACGLRNTREEIPMLVNTKYVSRNPICKKLWIFIFEEVRSKSEYADDEAKVKEIYEARGDWFLKKCLGEINLSEYAIEDNYDASIITWHIATEILYIEENNKAGVHEMEFSKILSDYMFYLLVNQPNVVSAVAGIAQITAGTALYHLEALCGKSIKDMDGLHKRCFEGRVTDPASSLLNKGIKLTCKLRSLDGRKWETMSKVWVEMLSYAASHIKGEAHVQVLSKGGELLVFVWLLMAHFGCVYKSGWGVYFDDFNRIGLVL